MMLRKALILLMCFLNAGCGQDVLPSRGQQEQQASFRQVARRACPKQDLASLLFALSAATGFSIRPERTPQVLRLRDAVTQQEISLVGTVHYNPASIARAKEEVIEASTRYQKKLGAVVVESCKDRWEKSLDLAPPGSWQARFLESEMQSAAGAALQNDVPIMLGDTDVKPFYSRIKKLASESVQDLLNPLNGLPSIFSDLARTVPSNLDTRDIAESKLLLSGEKPLSPTDFARLDVLKGLIFTIIRYTSAIAIKAPQILLFLVATFTAVDSLENGLDAVDSLENVGASTLALLATSAFLTLEAGMILLMARVLNVAFLEERNAELARSIRRAAQERNAPVVAVLGGLHVNGVARLLMSQAIPDADGRPNDGTWWDNPQGFDPKLWT